MFYVFRKGGWTSLHSSGFTICLVCCMLCGMTSCKARLLVLLLYFEEFKVVWQQSIVKLIKTNWLVKTKQLARTKLCSKLAGSHQSAILHYSVQSILILLLFLNKDC